MKRPKGRPKARSKRKLVQAMEARALAKGKKPFTTVQEWATGTQEDADELLAAIRLLREGD